MTNQDWADRLIGELARLGAACFIISPGSRSTPLALAAARCPGIQAFSHFDERGSAYVALGWAKATGRPAVLICTSGTAGANYYPAVIEASMSRIPLIVITADRPPELLQCGANQAIDQNRLFGSYVRAFATIPCPEEGYPVSALDATMDHLFHQSLYPTPGPIHLNSHFREPLAPAAPLPPFPEYPSPPATCRYAPTRTITEAAGRSLIAQLTQAKQGLLLVGALTTQEDREAVAALAKRLRWPVWADILSGLRPEDTALPYYDLLLAMPEFREHFHPDGVLWIGDGFVSKSLMEYLAESRPPVIHITAHAENLDHARIVGHRHIADIAPCCRYLLEHLPDSPPVTNAARLPMEKIIAESIDRWLSAFTIPTEIGIARAVSRLLPEDMILFLGNSMPVRDMDKFALPSPTPRALFANRGASGIDGNIATAIGMALGRRQPCIALLGDVTLLHDLNSLLLASCVTTPLVLIVINNDGGGIFSFLPVARHEEYLAPWFHTPHHRQFEKVAAWLDIAYHRPDTMARFTENLMSALTIPGVTLIEVITRRDENRDQHREIQRILTDVCRPYFTAFLASPGGL